MNENTLINCGLSLEQAKIYTYLLGYGLSPAKQISNKTGIGRALTYKVIDQLIALDLIERRENIGKITLFLPKHPRNIKEMIEKKKQKLNHAFSDFSDIFGKLSSEFNALTGKPNIQFYEGMEGLELIYQEILDIGENIMVISSPLGKDDEKRDALIKHQIEKQGSNNIKTRAITPLPSPFTEERVKEDQRNLIERKIVDIKKLNIPAQIIMYSDKVAITNFKESLITVLIESKYISETFKIMFEYIWKQD
jgi:HTH-type transcriptional regulator, sugar sensing transcriptional regulator